VPEDYIHRVGRTARAELTGEAFTLVSAEEEAQLGRIERAVGSRINRVLLDDFAYDAVVETSSNGSGQRNGNGRNQRRGGGSKSGGGQAKAASQSQRENGSGQQGNGSGRRPSGDSRGGPSTDANGRSNGQGRGGPGRGGRSGNPRRMTASR